MVSNIGDINNDGYSDVIVATPWADTRSINGKYISISNIIFGTSTLTTIEFTNLLFHSKGLILRWIAHIINHTTLQVSCIIV